MSKWGKLKQKALQKMGKAERSEADPELAESLEVLAMSRNHLENTMKAEQSVLKSKESLAESACGSGDAWAQFGLAQHCDLGEAMCRFGEAQKAIADMAGTLSSIWQTDVVDPMAVFAREEIDEGKAAKHRYYEATLAYDAQKEKVQALQRNESKNAGKIPSAQAELDSLGRARENVGKETLATLKAIEEKKQKLMYAKMHEMLIAQYGYFQNVFEMLRELEPFMKVLDARANGRPDPGEEKSAASSAVESASNAAAAVKGKLAGAFGLGAGAAAGAAAVSATSSSSSNSSSNSSGKRGPPPPVPARDSGDAAASSGNPFGDDDDSNNNSNENNESAGKNPFGDDDNDDETKNNSSNKKAAIFGAGAAAAVGAGALVKSSMSDPNAAKANAAKAQESAAKANAKFQQGTQDATNAALEKQKQAAAIAEEKAKAKFATNPLAAAAIGAVGAKATSAAAGKTEEASMKMKAKSDAASAKVDAGAGKVNAGADKASKFGGMLGKK